jgi:hypothetical protein
MNRRRFLQTASVSTAAALHSSAQSSAPLSPPAAPADTPFGIDIADLSAAAHVANNVMDLFVRLEEPDEPGDLSGAALCIADAGEDVALVAAFRDIPQRGGRPATQHFLGAIPAADLAPIASTDPKTASEGFCVAFREGEKGSGLCLMFLAGEDPELGLYIMSGREAMAATLCVERGERPMVLGRCLGHCLGVLRGELLARFFDFLRRRSAWGGAETL